MTRTLPTLAILAAIPSTLMTVSAPATAQFYQPLPPAPMYSRPLPVMLPPPPMLMGPVGMPQMRSPVPPPPPINPIRGQVYNAMGMNYETQVGMECAQQFGVSKAAAVCIAGRLTAAEINKCFSDGIGGRGCFGDNNTLVRMVSGNIDAARRESTVAGAVVRGTTGISPDAIRERGVLGGDNSEARKICNGVAGVLGGRC